MNNIIVLDAVKEHPLVYEYLNQDCRYDKEITLEAVKQYGWLLKYTSDELKKDYDVVFAALLSSIDAVQYVSPEFHYDEKCMRAINSHPVYDCYEDYHFVIKEGVPFEENEE